MTRYSVIIADDHVLLATGLCNLITPYLRRLGVRSDDIAFYLVHLPLPGHRFARPAARASECAHAEGRFAEMVDAIYDSQDSLGSRGRGMRKQPR